MWDALNHVTGRANVRLHHCERSGSLQMIATAEIDEGEEVRGLTNAAIDRRHSSKVDRTSRLNLGSYMHCYHPALEHRSSMTMGRSAMGSSCGVLALWSRRTTRMPAVRSLSRRCWMLRRHSGHRPTVCAAKRLALALLLRQHEGISFAKMFDSRVVRPVTGGRKGSRAHAAILRRLAKADLMPHDGWCATWAGHARRLLLEHPVQPLPQRTQPCSRRFRIPRSGKPPAQLLQCVAQLLSIDESAPDGAPARLQKRRKRPLAASAGAAEMPAAAKRADCQRQKHQAALVLLRRVCDKHIDILSRLPQGRDTDAYDGSDELTSDLTTFNDAEIRHWRHRAAATVRTEELVCWQAFKRWLEQPLVA